MRFSDSVFRERKRERERGAYLLRAIHVLVAPVRAIHHHIAEFARRYAVVVVALEFIDGAVRVDRVVKLENASGLLERVARLFKLGDVRVT